MILHTEKLNHPFGSSRIQTKNISISRQLVIIAFFALTKIIITQQYENNNNNHNSHLESIDEEIRIIPQHDYETSSSNQHSQTFEQINPNQEKQFNTIFKSVTNEKQSTSLEDETIDPFSVTFEDYLKEASKSSAHHIVDSSNEVSSFSREKPEISNVDPATITIEEEDNLIKPKELSNIDYNTIHLNKHETLKKEKFENKNFSDLLAEIKSLFAWKKLPTNKCSKTCGKGYRLNYFSCIDLKYDVKVEDTLCIKANIPKPNETSDEPCNEIDCTPEWTSIEYQECNSSIKQNNICHRNIYKKVQCMMVDKNGNSIHLDDSKCNNTQGTSMITNNNNNNLPIESNHSNEERKLNNIQFNDNIEINLEDNMSENNDKNDILSINEQGSQVHEHNSFETNSALTRFHQDDEPFYDLGPWSECQGSVCGQLGKRTRKVSCRLYLFKSAKYVDLPEKSCHHLASQETQEPCYLDCPFEYDTNNSKSLTDFKIVNNNENIDETIYDLDITRYIWRSNGYTKCSADCLGGKRENIIECWDTVASSAVDSSLCEQSMKPQIVIESCNEVPCQPEWRVERFSECTRTCGSAGIKTRSVVCIQRVPTIEGFSSMVVSNDLCNQLTGTTYNKTEPCNRVDCRPEWSVGPWSECSNKCGEGIRNRTVICVQEFAAINGPSKHTNSNGIVSPDLLEAVEISSIDWHPGKATQVPFHECYQEYRTIPMIDEKCFNYCERQLFIDSDPFQNYQLTWNNMKKKTVTLKVGGKAEIMEGKNLKIRCKVINRRGLHNLVNKSSLEHIEWLKDGIRIFTNGSTMADKLYVLDDNSIIDNDISSDEKNQFMADDPHNLSRMNKLDRQKTRTLNIRSSSNLYESIGNFTFIPKIGGRFSLVKENTLKIKKLSPDDSGIYKCSYGVMDESLELKVLSRQEFIKFGSGKKLR